MCVCVCVKGVWENRQSSCLVKINKKCSKKVALKMGNVVRRYVMYETHR